MWMLGVFCSRHSTDRLFLQPILVIFKIYACTHTHTHTHTFYFIHRRVLPAYTMSVPGFHGDQKRVSGSLDLELQVVVSKDVVGVGNGT